MGAVADYVGAAGDAPLVTLSPVREAGECHSGTLGRCGRETSIRRAVTENCLPPHDLLRPSLIANYNRYFVIMCLGGALGVGAAGEIAKVSQTFQPSGRCSAPNSL